MIPSRIAVVIPAHDEQDLLPACLRSVLTAAAASTVPVEIVVVADACTDQTENLARQLSAQQRGARREPGAPRADAGVSVLSIAARNVGAARAAGMGHALRFGNDGLWLATTDADSRVRPDWLSWHLTHARAGADLLTGTVEVDDWSAWPPDLPARYEAGYRAVPAHAHGANLGLSAPAYRLAGGFPPVRHDEDVALIARVREKGGRIVADPSCPVVTSARPQGRAPQGFAAHLAALAVPETPVAREVAGRP